MTTPWYKRIRWIWWPTYMVFYLIIAIGFDTLEGGWRNIIAVLVALLIANRLCDGSWLMSQKEYDVREAAKREG